MTILTVSKGIIKRKALIEHCFNQTLSMFSSRVNYSSEDVVVGWGLKANTLKAKKIADTHNLKYLHLEDGFIGYIGHPARKGHVVALIADELGVYYDARKPCLLESYIAETLSSIQHDRTQKLIEKIVDIGATKYNCYESAELPAALAKKLSSDKRPCILIVDQVAGDLSIAGAMADQDSFIKMVTQAKKNHPNARLLLRTHPDTRFGRKLGVLAQLRAKLALPQVEIIDEHCHPHALIKAVDAVYTVSSQMGFEALLYNKAVYCFGLPFYAGWGLTHDILVCERRGTATVEQLVHAALIKYTKYYDPTMQQACELENVLTLIELQYTAKVPYRRLFLVGFSLWKRGFMRHFCRHLSAKLIFVNKPPISLAFNEKVLVWGTKYPELTDCIRVEDGFIRSSGLGANLSRPSSLSFDKRGIYFDSRTASDIETLLNHSVVTASNKSRAESLIQLLRRSGVSKYNVGQDGNFEIDAKDKLVILVVGQVDGDASITTGSPHIKSNEALLNAVREANPESHIIYKPHPDVVSGNRSGSVSKLCLQKCVDSIVTDFPLTSLYSKIDELHTMTSLSGFEALIHNVKVHTWGQPFYAGWGLTTDHYPPPRRETQRSLLELVYVALIEYPLYIDWQTGLWTSPEILISKLSNIKNASIKKRSFISRNVLKLNSILGR
ncbi:capsular polysaccharide biosynthesis protein [Paraglaciecola arctica]|uniref:capsular polysaccharide biosynthesis protein n=1 Tax=Paraglaciecola arctica TaxID=1128911 RepID=UPI001C06DFF4|nr:capsular polysaccharide biosynthesis protein [Paraglaciecola arctica]MBU3003369.1 capsular polysaccharide biosynthesis protein [Paraglaciecola arctica]